jgi:hypothetical protein
MSLALTLGFDSYDPAFSSNSIHIADLFIVNGPFAGMTVGELFAAANDAIGGCTNTYDLNELNTALDSINNNYDNGTQDLGYLSCEPLHHCSCTPPTGITITAIENDQVQVCWDAQECAKGYILQYQWKGHSNWLTVNVNSPEHCGIFDLKGHTNIAIKVATICSDGSTTDYSTVINYRYTAPCTKPSHLSTTNIGPTSATANWTPGTATTSQKLRYQVQVLQLQMSLHFQLQQTLAS